MAASPDLRPVEPAARLAYDVSGKAVRRLEDDGADRYSALTQMLAAYMERMHANEPVHTWE